MSPEERRRSHRIVNRQGDLVVEVRRDGASEDWTAVGVGQLDAEGGFSTAIYAKEVRDEGYAAASGGLAFTLLFEAAQRTGTVSCVLGEWWDTSDNHIEYRRNLAQGMSVNASAQGTFTGRQATSHGYPDVASVSDCVKVVRAKFVGSFGEPA